MISVIVITKDNFNQLVETLDSISGVSGIEIITINGGQCSKTKEYLLRNLFIQVSEPDHGIADAYNKGLKLARGDAIVFLNSGDRLIRKDYIPWAQAQLAQNSKIDFIHSSIIFEDPIAGDLHLKPARYPIARGQPYFFQTMIIRKIVFDRLGTFDRSFRIACDYDLIVRIEKSNCIGEFYSEGPVVRMDGAGVSATQEMQTLMESLKSLKQNHYLTSYGKLLWLQRFSFFSCTKNAKGLKVLFTDSVNKEVTSSMITDSSIAANQSVKWLWRALVLYSFTSLISMAVMNIGFAILFIAFVYHLKVTNSFHQLSLEVFQNPLLRQYLKCSGLLMLACILSLIGALLWPLDYADVHIPVKFFKWITKFWYFFIPIVVFFSFRALSKSKVDDTLRYWVYFAAALLLIGIIQFFTGWPRWRPIPGYDFQRFHTVLFMGHHLSLGSIFIFPFFYALDQWKFSHARINYLIASLAMLITIILMFSRNLWISVLLSLLVWIILTLPKSKAIYFCLAAILLGFGLYQSELIQTRVKMGGGIGDRVTLWKANIKFFKERPITGVGWRRNSDLTSTFLVKDKPKSNKHHIFVGHAHNNLLDFLGGTGVIGVCAWMLWSLFTLVLSYRVSLGLFCGWIAFHLNGLTQVNFWDAKVMHQMMWVTGIILILAFHKRGSYAQRPL